MTGVLYRLAGFCVRRRFAVLGVWVVVTIALVRSRTGSATTPTTTSRCREFFERRERIPDRGPEPAFRP